LEYIEQALRQGKWVITANKEVMAKHGPRLLSIAESSGVEIRYEASVGGGIPLISPFQQDLVGNKVIAIHAIINGTTNYILTRMSEEGLDFPTALKQAQEMGYAEADPSSDIEGIDAAYKLAILASLAFHTYVHPEDVYREGIERLSWRDFRYAKELGYAIKLLAIAKEREGAIEVRTHPVLIPENYLLAKVEGAYNAVQVEGDLVGKVIFYGMGAGSLPTTSAVLADIVEAAKKLYKGIKPTIGGRWERAKPIKPMSQLQTRYYLRMTVADRPGVLAQISKILGDLQISIASVIQKDTDEKAGTAEIVIMTHPSLEEGMQRALKEIAQLAVVTEISNFIRVEV
jgi:homoserine dehydrogenase